MRNRWSPDEAEAFVARHAGRWGEELALRAYSSRLLGSEPDLVLHGGGNTSVKGVHRAPDGARRPAIWVKASGRDMADIGPGGHSGLDLERLRGLRTREDLSDEEMLNDYRLSLLDHRAATPSLETLVHAFLPGKFIDHTHADAVLALTNQPGGARLVREALGEEVLVVGYVAPGFPLAKVSADAHDAAPGKRGMIWMRHGIVTWGETARESYEAMIDLVGRAEAFLDRKAVRALTVPAPTPVDLARARCAALAPVVRGLLARPTGQADRPHRRVLLAPLVDDETLGFVDSAEGRDLALSPPLTTDHLIRTGPLPMWVDAPRWDDPAALRETIAGALRDHAAGYEAYTARNAVRLPEGVELFDACPRVVLLPGLGALCAGPDARAAGIARDITAHTLRVKRRIGAMGRFEGLSERELFDMEYRGMQHAKLGAGGSGSLLAGQVALVTGAAGAIGSGICRELLDSGAHVAVTDLPGERLDGLVTELGGEFAGRVASVPLDVTDAGSVEAAFDALALTWGGVDVVVVNAGIAHVAPLVDLAMDDFRRLQRVNVEGTLLVLAEAGRRFERQATGGDIVVVSSKNVFSPGAGFGAYSATKAAAHQLARIAALEMAPIDVRVNMVAPDAVFSEGERKSGLWEEVGPDRMRARGLDAAGLEEYYRNRSLLKVPVTARHVGRAVVFFASRRTPTTGATIPVDGGLPDAAPR